MGQPAGTSAGEEHLTNNHDPAVMLNLITNVGSVAATMLIGLWFTPFLLKNLGAAAYGLVPLATTVVSYFSLLTQTAGSSISRHLTVAANSADPTEEPRLFQSSLRMCLVLGAMLLVPLAALSIAAPWLIDIPATMDTETRILFAGVSVAFLLSVLITPYQSVLFTKGRIYVTALATIVQTVVRVGVAVALFLALSPRLSYVALGIALGTLCSTLLCVWIAGRVAPHLMEGRYPDAQLSGEVLGTAGGLVLTQLGTVLLLSADILLVNLWFGAHAAGEFAAVLQLALILRVAAMSVAVVFSPRILDLHAKGHMEQLVRATRRGMKALGLLMALPIGLICGSGGDLLRVWLGPEFGGLGSLLIVMVAPMVINSVVLPLFSVSLGANKTHLPGLVTVVSGFAHLLAAWAIAVALDAGPIGVAISAAIVLSIKNLLFTPLYAAANVGQPLTVFLKPLLQPMVVALGIGAVIRVLIIIRPPGGVHQLGLEFALVTVAYLLVLPALLGKEDRALLANKIGPTRRKWGRA